jgi:hypothetical protein
MNKNLRSTFLGIALLPFALSATTYYVSPTGNDNNNGTSQTTPWRTLARVQQLSNYGQPGDQILFARGGSYPGQLQWNSSGTAASNIVFGAYGTGAQPIINGATTVTGWTQHSGNIYRANVSQSVKYVFVNGALQTLARYPNTGWLRVSTCNNTQLTSSNLTQSSGHWSGATMVLRSTNWCYENRTINTHSGNSLTFPATTYYAGNYNWGFFLCNKLSELDSPGEWYHDAATGVLYLWAPTGVNPNGLNVEASVYDYGIWTDWQRGRIRIQDINFKGQKLAGVNIAGGSFITVTGCTFEKLYAGIDSYGWDNTYTNNIYRNTYASAVSLIDERSTVSNSTFTDIALVAGLGESAVGYFGIHMIGQDNIIRENRLSNIGYSAIFVHGSPLVERNVISGYLATVNDGGGIYWDNGNNMVIQDNIVRDPIGNMESVATNYQVNYRICHGIYFGNAVITGTIVQRNTVSGCSSGIHVDHTMVSENNQVKNNILFNNTVQLSISDYSNYNGPGAQPPYYRATYNTVYSGNQLYSLHPDQLCVSILNVYQQGNVDFGNFSNNKVYNPYNELSIYSQNLSAGNFKFYTLERWQAERSEEAGSTRSPLRSTLYSTTSELSSNLVLNGTFGSNVNGWGGWPTNAQVTRDLSYLDAGALKANLPNNTQSSWFYLRNPDQFSMQNGQWYRMKFSVQSNIHGIVQAGVKGISQLSSPVSIFEKSIPFDGQRRDMELYFQGNLTEQALTQFTNTIVEPTYWLDNVELHRVTVTPRVPANEHILFINDQATSQNFTLPADCWSDMNGNLLSGPQAVAAYSSKIIYKVTGTGCNSPTASSVGAKILLGGPLNWSTGVMRDDLRQQGLIPSTEPYSSMGYALENSGASLTASLLTATGSTAIVDWVMLELRSVDGVTVSGRRAALVRANGQVISTTGDPQITFNVPTVGKKLVIRHRNHLSVMATSTIATNGQVVDFTLSSTATYGTSALKVSGSYRGMWPGDVNSDGIIIYTGGSNDRDVVLVTIGSTVATNTVQGYSRSDANMDGWSIYTGTSNDRDLILQSIGGVVPTTVRQAQLP